MCRSKYASGFTLVEVLIALAITAFVATIAYSSLSTVKSVWRVPVKIPSGPMR